MTWCRFLTEVVLADSDFLPENLREVLENFAYAYMPRIHIAVIVCRRDGEVTVTLAHDGDAVYDACLRACVRAAQSQQGWPNWVDAVDACRRECRGAFEELVREDIETGVKLLSESLKKANIEHKVGTKADIGAVLNLRL